MAPMWYHAQVIQHYYTNLPADVAVNNLYFSSGSPTPATAEMDRILTVINSAWGALEDFRAGILKATAGMTVKIYDVTAPPHSSPLRIGGPYNMGAPESPTNMPLEVAGVISFQGAVTAGTNPARRRGRNYIGPLNTAALDAGSASTMPKLTTGFIAGLLDYAEQLEAVNIGAGACTWCVYSKTDNAMVPVTNGWVDDAFDTQRRRGNDTTARTLFTF